MNRMRACPARPAFTLIELLVAMSIIVVIAALALFITPSFGEQQKTSMGASSVQGWLFVAKQRAFRDKLTRGVAFIPASDNNNWVRQLQYIEQPDDYASGAVVSSGNTVTLSAGLDLSFLQPNNDILVLTNVTPPEPHRISGVAGTTLTLTDAVSAKASGAGTSYIIRGVRPLDGEPLLNLTQDIIVDFATYAAFPSLPAPLSQGAPTMSLSTSPTGQAWYVLFSPQGGLQLGTGSTTGRVNLWVRDSLKDSPTDGQPTLITVYARAGAIGAFPVNTDSTLGGSYYFSQNGVNSGM
jgi:prepilin-type N-terminal cleavage/methylation domain-containing protein